VSGWGILCERVMLCCLGEDYCGHIVACMRTWENSNSTSTNATSVHKEEFYIRSCCLCARVLIIHEFMLPMYTNSRLITVTCVLVINYTLFNATSVREE
jgi:hypothetical protein